MIFRFRNATALCQRFYARIAIMWVILPALIVAAHCARAELFPSYADPTPTLEALTLAVEKDRAGDLQAAASFYSKAVYSGHLLHELGDDIAVAALVRLSQLYSGLQDMRTAAGYAIEAEVILNTGKPRDPKIIAAARTQLGAVLKSAGFPEEARERGLNDDPLALPYSEAALIDQLDLNNSLTARALPQAVQSRLDLRADVMRKSALIELMSRNRKSDGANDMIKSAIAIAATKLTLNEPYFIEYTTSFFNKLTGQRPLDDEEFAALERLSAVARRSLGPANEMRQGLRFMLSKQNDLRGAPDVLSQLGTAEAQLNYDSEVLATVFTRKDPDIDVRTNRVVKVAHQVRQLSLKALRMSPDTLKQRGVTQNELLATAFRAAQLETLGPIQNAVRFARIRAAARTADMWYTHNLDGQINIAKTAKEDLRKHLTERHIEKAQDVFKDLEWSEASSQFGEAKFSSTIPDFYEIRRVNTANVETLVANIDPDTAIILISSGPKNTDAYPVVFVVTDQGAVVSQPDWSPEDFAHAISAYRQSLLGQTSHSDQVALRAPLETLPKHNDLNLALGHEIFRNLFAHPDISAALATKSRWLISTHGAFQSLPFAALPMHEVDTSKPMSGPALRNVAWLGTERELVLINDLGDPVRFFDPKSNAIRDSYVGFGDPSFSGRISRLRTAQILDVQNAKTRLEAIARLPRLPGTSREIHATAALFRPNARAVRLGTQANENELHFLSASGALRGIGILHLATHGLVGPKGENSFGAALALAPPQLSAPIAPGKTNDGLLTIDEISLLQLDADWVILSACDTAAGDGENGDALTGLARVFLTSGARNLLATHWPIEDHVAQTIVSSTLSQARGGMAPSAALQSAIKSVIDDKSRDGTALPSSHPMVWAPFILFQS
ncbi:MAG: CHAT domain-containing protein [Pseudomonadota bacterium]